MKKLNLILTALTIGLISITTLTSCKKEGCTDGNAGNYDSEAKKDDGTCTYPTIKFNVSGSDVGGDVTGKGGTVSGSTSWSNSKSAADWNMDLTAATGGTFQLIIKDAVGATVVSKTLTAGSGDDSASGKTTSGTSGTWTVSITLTNFSGDGSYSISPED